MCVYSSHFSSLIAVVFSRWVLVVLGIVLAPLAIESQTRLLFGYKTKQNKKTDKVSKTRRLNFLLSG